MRYCMTMRFHNRPKYGVCVCGFNAIYMCTSERSAVCGYFSILVVEVVVASPVLVVEVDMQDMTKE